MQYSGKGTGKNCTLIEPTVFGGCKAGAARGASKMRQKAVTLAQHATEARVRRCDVCFSALLRAIEAQQQQLRVALAAAHTEMLEQASEQSVQLQLRLATQSAALAEADGRLQGASAAMLAASAGSKADTARAAELTS